LAHKSGLAPPNSPGFLSLYDFGYDRFVGSLPVYLVIIHIPESFRVKGWFCGCFSSFHIIKDKTFFKSSKRPADESTLVWASSRAKRGVKGGVIAGIRKFLGHRPRNLETKLDNQNSSQFFQNPPKTGSKMIPALGTVEGVSKRRPLFV